MNKFALLGAAALMMSAGPALAQAGGGATPPPNAGSAGGGGASDRNAMLNRDDGVNAQQMMDRQGRLNADFAKSAKKAEAYRNQLQGFADSTAPRKADALALRESALSGKAITLSAKEIRDQLIADMEEWRKAFKIDKAQYQGLRDQIIVDESALTARQWADRRAQWFDLRDEWIAQEVASTQQGG